MTDTQGIEAEYEQLTEWLDYAALCAEAGSARRANFQATAALLRRIYAERAGVEGSPLPPTKLAADDADELKDALHDLVMLNAQDEIGCVPPPTREQWSRAWATAEELVRNEP